MDGIQFEEFIESLLERTAFSDVCTTPVKRRPGSGPAWVYSGPQKAVEQTETLAGGVGNSAIQEVLGAMLFYDADVGFVFTNSSFTNGARALTAKDPRIHLVDRVELGQMIRKIFDREGAPKQNKRAGHSVAVASTSPMASALPQSPARPLHPPGDSSDRGNPAAPLHSGTSIGGHASSGRPN